jgi:hypothetical protein
MKILVTLLLLAGAFVYGYHVGHQPNSPDVLTFLQQQYTKAAEMARQVTNSPSAPSKPAANHTVQTVVVEVPVANGPAVSGQVQTPCQTPPQATATVQNGKIAVTLNGQTYLVGG